MKIIRDLKPGFKRWWFVYHYKKSRGGSVGYLACREFYITIDKNGDWHTTKAWIEVYIPFNKSHPLEIGFTYLTSEILLPAF